MLVMLNKASHCTYIDYNPGLCRPIDVRSFILRSSPSSISTLFAEIKHTIIEKPERDMMLSIKHYINIISIIIAHKTITPL